MKKATDLAVDGCPQILIGCRATHSEAPAAAVRQFVRTPRHIAQIDDIRDGARWIAMSD